MNYVDPFLQEQQRIAGMQPGSGVEQVSIDIPSLQQPQKTDLPDTVLPGPSLLDMAMAKKMKQAPSSVQPQQPSSEQMSQPVPQQSLPPQNKPPEQFMAETGQQSALDQMGKEGFKPAFQPTPLQKKENTDLSQSMPQQAVNTPLNPSPQNKVFGGDVTVSAQANNPYLNGRINRGTDFAGKQGTPVALPEGSEWEVVSSVNNVSKRIPEDFSPQQNYGWGNSVVVKNAKTGEKMRLSHMQHGSVPDLKQGQVLKGGTVIGAIGNTGNTHGETGNHLDVEYYNSKGERLDVLQSPYSQYFAPR